MSLETRRVREVRSEVASASHENKAVNLEDIKKVIDSLPTRDMDIKWVREHEGKEYHSLNTSQMSSVSSFGKKHDTSSVVDDFDQLLNEYMNSFPVPQTVKEPEVIEKRDDSTQFDELYQRVNKKYEHLLSELSALYNSETIDYDAEVLKIEIESIMTFKSRTIDELKNADEALNRMVSKLAKLAQRADEVKASDDFKIDEQTRRMKFLEDYQNSLIGKYGKYWFGKMTDQEKEQYIGLYTTAHNVTRDVVLKQIDDSIDIAYLEITSRHSATTQNSNTDYKATIKTVGNQAVHKLKEIHDKLDNATLEQAQEFKDLYAALSELSKAKTNGVLDEQQKLKQVYELSSSIDQLQSSIDKGMSF